MKKLISKSFSNMAHWIVRKNIADVPVCIFSNDCWGGEFYRCTGRPYNTPFVGLMLMAPCYIQLLEKPAYYLEQELEFINTSKYADLQAKRQHRAYPLGLLGGLEIHFLHYKSTNEAAQKWNRRKQRIDWEHLYVKFAMDKDYADEQLLAAFGRMPYKNKISFSRSTYSNPVNFKVKGYVDDGAQLFPRCFKELNLFQWFQNGSIKTNAGMHKLINPFVGRFLKIS